MYICSIKHVWMNAKQWLIKCNSLQKSWDFLGLLSKQWYCEFQKQTSTRNQWRLIYMVSHFSSQMKSDSLFWRKSYATDNIFGEYQWFLIIKPVQRLLPVKNYFVRTFGLMSFFLAENAGSVNRNASIRIQIFPREPLANDWEDCFKCQMRISCPVLTSFQYLTAVCSFVNLIYIFLKQLASARVSLSPSVRHVWGKMLLGGFELLIKKSIICVLAARWMWQHAECGLQTCRGESGRIHLLVTLPCQQPKWVTQICHNQVAAGFSECTANCVSTAKALVA